MKYNQIILIAYVCYLTFMSLVTFMLFIVDKRKATKNSGPNRIKEKTLLGAVAFGGAIGGFLGRIIARHKTNKLYFSLTIYLSILLQLGVLGFMIYMMF